MKEIGQLMEAASMELNRLAGMPLVVCSLQQQLETLKRERDQLRHAVESAVSWWRARLEDGSYVTCESELNDFLRAAEMARKHET
jgi:hypothetical protein